MRPARRRYYPAMTTEPARYSLWEIRDSGPERLSGHDSLHAALALVPGLAASKQAALVVNHNGVDGVRLCYESPAARAHPEHEQALEKVAAHFGVSSRELRGRPQLGSLEAPGAALSEDAVLVELGH